MQHLQIPDGRKAEIEEEGQEEEFRTAFCRNENFPRLESSLEDGTRPYSASRAGLSSNYSAAGTS